MNDEELEDELKAVKSRKMYGRIELPKNDDRLLRDYCQKKRLLNGWTYGYVGKQVAHRNGKPYSKMNIYNWLTGRVHFGPEYAFKMAEAFRVHPVYAAFLLKRLPDYELIDEYPDEAETVKFIMESMRRMGYKIDKGDKDYEII